MDFGNVWRIVGIYQRIFGWRWRSARCHLAINRACLTAKKCSSNGATGDISTNGGIGGGVPCQRRGAVATNFVGNGGSCRRGNRRCLATFQTKKRRYQNHLRRGADSWRYQTAVLVDTFTLPTPILCNCRHKRRHCGLLGGHRWIRKNITINHRETATPYRSAGKLAPAVIFNNRRYCGLLKPTNKPFQHCRDDYQSPALCKKLKTRHSQYPPIPAETLQKNIKFFNKQLKGFL